MFGSIQSAPSFQTSRIINATSGSGIIAANTWLSILGGGLSATFRAWQAADFANDKLLVQLDNVGVTVNGEPAYVSHISPTQINFLVPADLQPGSVQIQTTNNGLTSRSVSVTLPPAAPSFFPLSGTKYIAATHSDGALLI